MKISKIITYPVKIGIRNQLLVKVETDEGVSGWGESGLSGREKAVIGAIEHFSEWLIGKPAFQIGSLWQELTEVSILKEAEYFWLLFPQLILLCMTSRAKH